MSSYTPTCCCNNVPIRINSVTGQRTYNKAEAVNPTGSFVGPAASPAMGAATNPLAGPAVGPVNPMLAPVFPAQGNPYAMQNPMPGYGAQYPYQGGYMTQGGYTTQGAYPAGVAYPAGSIAPVNLGGIQPQNLNGNNVNGQNVNHAYWPNGSGS